MKSTSKDNEPAGLTPEHVMDLGRREWFESIMNSLPVAAVCGPDLPSLH